MTTKTLDGKMPTDPIAFIKWLNSATGMHGREYRSLCGKFLAKHSQNKAQPEEK